MRRSGRYRGSRRSGGFVIPVLVVLCIIAAGALYVINNNMTFTREGSFFFNEKEVEPEKVEANLIIDSAEDQLQEQIEIREETPPASETGSETKALFVPIGTVKSAELFEAELMVAEAKKVNTLAFEVKAEDGTLAFSTNTMFGQSTGLAGESSVLSENIDKAKEAGYKVAFYLSCFKDNEAARKNQEHSVRTENKIIWLDGENTRWLSAYSETARAYLVDVIEELCAFSPDELILSNISFPVLGKTELVAYPDGGKDKSLVLAEFMKEASAAAGETPLSAVFENYNGIYLERSGQSVGAFAEVFDKLYVSRDAAKERAKLSDITVAKDKIIPIVPEAYGEEFMIKE